MKVAVSTVTTLRVINVKRGRVTLESESGDRHVVAAGGTLTARVDFNIEMPTREVR